MGVTCAVGPGPLSCGLEFVIKSSLGRISMRLLKRLSARDASLLLASARRPAQRRISVQPEVPSRTSTAHPRFYPPRWLRPTRWNPSVPHRALQTPGLATTGTWSAPWRVTLLRAILLRVALVVALPLLLASCANSDEAEDNPSASDQYLRLFAEVQTASVHDGDNTLEPPIAISSNALGAVTYTLKTEPPVDWFTVQALTDTEAALAFTPEKTAQYIRISGSVRDGSAVPIDITLVGTDIGRSVGNQTQISLTVQVLATSKPLELYAEPQAVAVNENRSAFDAPPRLSLAYLQGAASFSVSTNPPVDWFTVDAAQQNAAEQGAAQQDAAQWLIVRPTAIVDYEALPPSAVLPAADPLAAMPPKAIEVTVTALDLGRVNASTARTTLQVLVRNVLENSISFVEQNFVTLRTASATQSSAAPPIAVLQGSAQEEELRFVAEAHPFFLVAEDGTLRLQNQAAFAADNAPYYTLTVTAHAPDASPVTQQVRVSIVEHIDQITFPPGQTFSVTENVLPSAAGVLGTVQASAPSDDVRFAAEHYLFDVDPISGDIRLHPVVDGASLLDHESTPQYEISVTASAGTANSVAQAVIILVLNEPENWISFADASFAVAEDVSPGALLGALKAEEHPEAPPFDTLRYATEAEEATEAEGASQAASQIFGVDAQSGEIFLREGQTLDFEGPATQFQFVVTASAADALPVTSTVTVNLTNVRDNLISYTPPPTQIALEENHPPTVPLYTIVAQDAQGSLQFGVDNPLFAISAAGELFLNAGAWLDHETQDTHDLQIQLSAADLPGEAPRLDLQIRVLDVEEGLGTLEDPYRIDSLAALQSLAYGFRAHSLSESLTFAYVLTADIDASPTADSNYAPAKGGIAVDGPESIAGGSSGDDRAHGVGFFPIGSADNPFRGALDGQGYAIQGLTFAPSEREQSGLFLALQDATVHDLRLIDVQMRPPAATMDSDGVVGDAFTDLDDFGSLAGTAVDSTIRRVQLIGGALHGRRVGGLIASTSGGSVQDSLAIVHLRAAERAGGLIGSSNGTSVSENLSAGRIESFAADAVGVGGLVGSLANAQLTHNLSAVHVIGLWDGVTTSGGTDAVGGLIGFLGETDAESDDATLAASILAVSNAATGEVYGRNSVGGLVGLMHPTAETVAIRHSYASGDVRGRKRVGGVLGSNTGREGYLFDVIHLGDEVLAPEDAGGVLGSDALHELDSELDGEENTQFGRFYALNAQGDVTQDGVAGHTLTQLEALTCAEVVFLVANTEGEEQNCDTLGESNFPWDFGDAEQVPVLAGDAMPLSAAAQRALIAFDASALASNEVNPGESFTLAADALVFDSSLSGEQAQHLTYRWFAGENVIFEEANAATATLQVLKAGAHRLDLVILERSAAGAIVALYADTFTVEAAFEAAVLDATVAVQQAATLDASGLIVPEYADHALVYAWTFPATFLDVEGETTASPGFAVAAAGNYTVDLRVTEQDASGTAQRVHDGSVQIIAVDP